ncbi:site-specific integrase [Verrucomicrobia bacterium]|nr:site-specific integrase [Verrucomicrobiota bacterium]
MKPPSQSLKIDGPVVSGSKQVFIVKGTVHYPKKSFLRKRFETRIQAELYCNELDRLYLNDRSGGTTRLTKLSIEQENEHLRCLEVLNRIEQQNPTLLEAVTFYQQNYKGETFERVTFDDALEAYLKEISGNTYKYRRGVRGRLIRFRDAWKDEKTFVHEFTRHDLKEWIYSEKGDKRCPWDFKRGKLAKNGGVVSGAERRNEYSMLSGFFNFCYLDLEATPERIIEKVSKPQQQKRVPEAYTPEQAEKIIKAAIKLEELIAAGGPSTGKKPDPETKVVPYFALGLFSAIRPEEIKRLDWSDFCWNESGKVEVTIAGKGKSGTVQYRTITVPETCVEWIKPYRKDEGPVVPQKNIKNVQRVFAIAGYLAPKTSIPAKAWPELYALTGDPQAEGKVLPIHDGLRHSGVTYRLKVVEDDRKVGLWAGHNAEVQHSHYRALATEGQAQAYWKILPEGSDWEEVIKEKETKEFLSKKF